MAKHMAALDGTPSVVFCCVGDPWEERERISPSCHVHSAPLQSFSSCCQGQCFGIRHSWRSQGVLCCLFLLKQVWSPLVESCSSESNSRVQWPAPPWAPNKSASGFLRRWQKFVSFYVWFFLLVGFSRSLTEMCSSPTSVFVRRKVQHIAFS